MGGRFDFREVVRFRTWEVRGVRDTVWGEGHVRKWSLVVGAKAGDSNTLHTSVESHPNVVKSATLGWGTRLWETQESV